jgi:hypothetical protein
MFMLVAAVVGSGLPTTDLAAFELSSFEFFLGSAVNLNTPLEISQSGHPALDVTADYETRGFERPMYWSFRFGFNRTEQGAWEFQARHHKLFLTNPPPEVQHFEITHGFNILTFNRSFEDLPVTLRVGAGLVLAEPNTTIRGLSDEDAGGLFGSGYTLTGPAFVGGVSKDFTVWKGLFFVIEADLIAAWFRVPVVDGHAQGPNISLHGLAGLGYRF